MKTLIGVVLLRGLTGAGMNRDEAANYVRRYQFSPIDTSNTAIRKLNDLEAALRYIATITPGVERAICRF